MQIKNSFQSTSTQLTEKDLIDVEHSIGLRLPKEVRAHYLAYNGGVPSRTAWHDPTGEELVSVSCFLPMKYPTKQLDTIESIYNDYTQQGFLPRGIVPFAMDWGGNFVCFNDSGEVLLFFRDMWKSSFTTEQNIERSTKSVSPSFVGFVNGLD